MSAVTLAEIADLVAVRLKVPLAEMRDGIKKGRHADAEQYRVLTARDVVLVLARRHTKATLTEIARHIGINHRSVPFDAMHDAIETEAHWRAADRAVNAAIEDIEQQIDALHERRMAERDRNIVRV